MTDLRALVFKLRGGLWTALFIAVLFLARPVELWALLTGLFLVALGQGIRFWAAGSIVRYRGEQVGAQQLVTWGPYGLVRNPLYIGNGLIGAGWGMMAGWSAFFLFILVFILLYGVVIVPWEETFLRQRFGEEYEGYVSRTGQFIPKKWTLKELNGPFNTEVLWRSERHSVFVTLAGTALLLMKIWEIYPW
ncbi:MAG: isoprenylcysteine carboxylmethyltransferase family protein [Synergistaceae bacterium]|nr:isoprenylcysteine carboxylmethyltransferase family protein [Synergistaceae bacterium]